MPEKRVTVQKQNGEMGEGSEVAVRESTERWSEITLEDGTVFRAKLTVAGAVRVDGEFDQQGNPVYMMNFSPLFAIVSVPEHLAKKVH